MKKAVFFDIDGTLWDYDSVIPESAIEGIHAMQNAGNLAFICSGRSRGFIRAENLLGIGFDGIIAGCGTYIEDKEGKILFYKQLNNELATSTIKTLREHKLATVLEGREYLYMDEEDFKSDSYGQKLKREMGPYLRSIEEWQGKWEISKMSSTIPKDYDYHKLIEQLSPDYDVFIHGTEAMEFVPKGYNKASGIKKACELFGIDLKDTYAFGDSINDVEMLEYVNTGIAMGNSTPPALAVADYVTTSLSEDGIYKGLEHFGLM